MLTTGTAKGIEYIFLHIVATLYRDFFHRRSHIANGHLQKAQRQSFWRPGLSGSDRNLFRQLFKRYPYTFAVRWLILLWAKHRRKMCRLNTPQQQIAIGDGQWSAIAVAGWSGKGPGGFRADLETAVGKAHNGATARPTGSRSPFA